jgi:hypothetical protein
MSKNDSVELKTATKFGGWMQSGAALLRILGSLIFSASIAGPSQPS